MSQEHDEILDYFPEDHEGRSNFDKDDVVVLARIFADKVEAQVAVSLLRTQKIPHFLSDTNATLFTENVLGGERLFVRQEDLTTVSEILDSVKDKPYEGEEDWYKEVRTNQSYAPYRNLTFAFIFAIAAFFIFTLIYILLTK